MTYSQFLQASQAESIHMEQCFISYYRYMYLQMNLINQIILIVIVQCPAMVLYPSKLRGSWVWRKLFLQFPQWLVKPSFGPGVQRLCRDIGGKKSPILGPGFADNQHTLWRSVQSFIRDVTIFLSCTPADKVSAQESRGPHLGDRWEPL